MDKSPLLRVFNCQAVKRYPKYFPYIHRPVLLNLKEASWGNTQQLVMVKVLRLQGEGSVFNGTFLSPHTSLADGTLSKRRHKE